MHFLMPVKPTARTYGPLQVRDGPCSEVSVCSLVQVEEILSIFVICNLINDKNSTINDKNSTTVEW